MEFTIDDSPLTDIDVPPGIKKAQLFLDELEDGKLMTGITLASKIGLNHFYITSNTRFMSEYSILVNHNGTRKRLYGSKGTVQAWINQKNL